MFGQKLLVDPRFVIKTLGVSFGCQANQVAITVQIFGEQDEVKVCLLSGSGSRPIPSTAAGDVGLTTDYRFYATALHRVVKRDGAKHIAVIGHGACRHAELFSTLGQRLDLNCTVQEAVVGV